MFQGRWRDDFYIIRFYIKNHMMQKLSLSFCLKHSDVCYVLCSYRTQKNYNRYPVNNSYSMYSSQTSISLLTTSKRVGPQTTPPTYCALQYLLALNVRTYSVSYLVIVLNCVATAVAAIIAVTRGIG